MANIEDRRVKLTKKILKEAIIELLREKPIHDISIKKICEIADVNRSTFYHHYQSPQELYDDIINDIKNDINIIIHNAREQKYGKKEIIAELLTYVEKNRELILVILSDNGNIGIGQRLSGIVGQFIDASTNSELSVYCAQFISAGVTHILWLWLNKENRLPPKTVAGLIANIITHGVNRAVLFSSKDTFVGQ